MSLALVPNAARRFLKNRKESSLSQSFPTANQSGRSFADLGTFEYTYDSGGNCLTDTQTGSLTWLDADGTHTYDTADRLVTTRNKDTFSTAVPGWISTCLHEPLPSTCL